MEQLAEVSMADLEVSTATPNDSWDNDTYLNATYPNATLPRASAFDLVFTACYGLICVAGLVGNGLVIFVVLRYAKMKTVTNIYILNLAISDLAFLVGMPFLIVTALLKHWIFGYAMCKIFFILTSINWFTSVFTLTVMSADRYMAVCHPVRSMSYRTPMVSRIVCICVWLTSLLVMLPIMLYTTTELNSPGRVSCTISWPKGQAITPDRAFIWYGLLLGFAIPSALISVFYALVVLRLRTVGPKCKSKEKKKSHRKVTKMVLTVIAVYIVCWLPYWVFQIVINFLNYRMPAFAVYMFQAITVLSYANSMLNPFLYAFFSENFRKTFIKAFKCATNEEVNGTLHVEHSLFPGRRSGAGTTLTGGLSSTRTKMTTTDEDNDVINANDRKKSEEAELQPVLPTETIVANHKDTEGLQAKPTSV